MISNKTIILASGSRDRKEIFEKSGIPFRIIVSNYEEKYDENENLSPEELVIYLAKGKLETVKKKVKKPSYIIISADTIVDFNGNILGKAKNKEEAFRTLKLLSGKKHNLITGVCIYDSESDVTEEIYDKTIVEFVNLDDSEIWNYINHSNEYIGRAGAYSLRERAGFFIKSIEGSPSNVIGLPINLIYQVLKKFGVNLLEIPKK